jgi:hypothetical protein
MELARVPSTVMVAGFLLSNPGGWCNMTETFTADDDGGFGHRPFFVSMPVAGNTRVAHV